MAHKKKEKNKYNDLLRAGLIVAGLSLIVASTIMLNGITSPIEVVAIIGYTSMVLGAAFLGAVWFFSDRSSSEGGAEGPGVKPGESSEGTSAGSKALTVPYQPEPTQEQGANATPPAVVADEQQQTAEQISSVVKGLFGSQE